MGAHRRHTALTMNIGTRAKRLIGILAEAVIGDDTPDPRRRALLKTAAAAPIAATMPVGAIAQGTASVAAAAAQAAKIVPTDIPETAARLIVEFKNHTRRIADFGRKLGLASDINDLGAHIDARIALLTTLEEAEKLARHLIPTQYGLSSGQTPYLPAPATTNFTDLTAQNILAANPWVGKAAVTAEDAASIEAIAKKLLRLGFRDSNQLLSFISKKQAAVYEHIATHPELWPQDLSERANYLQHFKYKLEPDSDSRQAIACAEKNTRQRIEDERLKHRRLESDERERQRNLSREQEELKAKMRREKATAKRLADPGSTVRRSPVDAPSVMSFDIVPPYADSHLTRVDFYHLSLQLAAATKKTKAAKSRAMGQVKPGLTEVSDRAYSEDGQPYYRVTTRDPALLDYLKGLTRKRCVDLPFSSRALTRPAPMKLERLAALTT